MPTPTEILQSLAAIANEQRILAISWHVLLGITVIGIALGWRPAKRAGALALAIPLLSVSALAWAYGNPFNGLVFLLSAMAVIAIALRLSPDRVAPVPVWAAAASAVMIIFGWVYPHFLEGGGWLKYLYAAPSGLIPCPTLSLAIGFALLANGFSSRSLSITFGAIGMFYALFGAFRLSVRIDLILLFGAASLLILALTPGFSSGKPKTGA